MTVKFEWVGSTETESGTARYSLGNTTYELWLPDFKKAHQLHQVLEDVYQRGRNAGYAEMSSAVQHAMSLRWT
jgi:hypothetical protein